jgi:hypothetical protein
MSCNFFHSNFILKSVDLSINLGQILQLKVSLYSEEIVISMRFFFFFFFELQYNQYIVVINS